MGHVHDLSMIGDADRGRVGAKAASLGRLLQAGLPVPPGFCIEEGVAADDPAIVDAYQLLGQDLVAVRSSAAGEDESGAAAAGVYLSRLGIRGLAELVAAIDDVRGSARSAHVRTYQPGCPVPQVAVIVQRLVPAEVAGVVFTRDPADSDGNTLAVAAGWGLGTGVVGGAAADRFRVDRATGQLVEQAVAHKRTVHTIAGVEPAPQAKATVPCLALDQPPRPDLARPRGRNALWRAM